jgi:hypothetical protein
MAVPHAGATNSFSSGLHLIKSAFRSSDPGEVFSPRAVRIIMDGGLDFTPITLVFQDLRWVPLQGLLCSCYWQWLLHDRGLLTESCNACCELTVAGSRGVVHGWYSCYTA